ncbi:unnamed protein product [Laminaria digitata]
MFSRIFLDLTVECFYFICKKRGRDAKTNAQSRQRSMTPSRTQQPKRTSSNNRNSNNYSFFPGTWEQLKMRSPAPPSYRLRLRHGFSSGREGVRAHFTTEER